MTKNDKATDPTILKRAREMRKNLTAPEAKLWQRLRGRQLDGHKFRRQHPIDRFIVDFYCHEARLIVEVDGESHAFQQEYDRERSAFLISMGNRVIRFSNEDVMQRMDGVLEVILQAFEERPSPGPSQTEGSC
jgi:very-short-patch-repair endonuclease